MSGLSFVTLLAYDYEYAFNAIASYYPIADEILLGLDRDRLTWSRRPFGLDREKLDTFLRGIDTAKKIRIVEGDFHSAATPMENDTAERNALSHECRPGNWVVQIDSDEILMNPEEFRTWLLAQPTGICATAIWVTVFKVFGRQALVIVPPSERAPVATMARGQYLLARETREPHVESPLDLMHLSWGRTDEELRTKLDNWGHATDFDIERYFQFWRSVTLDNYPQFENFHPLMGPLWPRLQLIEL